MKFTYSIPTIGKVEINFNGYPYKFYQIMERHNEVERLKKLEHLGVLQNIFPGIRHTRWDYTMTMLYLIQRLREAGLEGLSRTRKVGEIVLSGRDIMQLLALVANIGHFPGTFAVEKGIMRYIAQSKELRNKLKDLAAIDDEQFSQINYFTLNKLMALVKLQWWQEEADDAEKNLISAVKQLVKQSFLDEPPTEHHKKIVEYFNFVRRMSYQLLDCLYVNLPVRVEYAEFIKQLPTLSLERKQLSALMELIDQYTRIVYKQIYHSQEARKIVADSTAQIYEQLQQKGDVLSILKSWLSDWDQSNVYSNSSPAVEIEQVFSVTIPHGFWPSFLIETFVEKGVDTLEIDLITRISGIKPLILYIPGLRDPILEAPTSGDLVFEVYLDQGMGDDACIKVAGSVLLWIHHVFGKTVGVGRITEALFKSILRHILPDDNIDINIDITQEEFFKDKDYYFRPEERIEIFSAGKRKEAVQMFQRENKQWTSRIKEQFNECKVLQELIKRKWMDPQKGEGRYHLVVPGRIRFIDQQSRQQIAEFDGAFLTLVNRKKRISKMKLFLIEAKSGKRTGPSAAEKELRSKLKRLEITRPNRIRRILKKNAYVEIKVI